MSKEMTGGGMTGQVATEREEIRRETAGREATGRETIAIVGAGLIGRAWAIVFARSGFQVTVCDQVPAALDTCLDTIAERLADLKDCDLIDEAPETVLARIRPVATLEEAVAQAVLVQENVAEKIEVKRELFMRLDQLAPRHAVLASSTSWLPASSFTEHVPGRARCLVAHPTNPPYLVPLVELAPAPWTSAQTVERARALYTRAGQTPVLLKKEITGFLLNRVQSAVLSEVFALYRDGYADAEDLDRVLKDGLALRWSFMGPFETIDLNAPQGVLDYAQRYGPTYRDVAESAVAFDWDRDTLNRLDAERREQLSKDDIEERAAWRDRRLMALIAHKRAQPER